MSNRQPTQADVARRAGVSRATVSLVLNGQLTGRVPISEATRQKVLQSSRELGYAPNAAAQMLARGRNQLIGVFTYEPRFPYESEDFYHPYLLGIEHEASRQDYNLLLFTRHRSAGQRRIYIRGTNGLSLADGAILIGAYPDRDELCRLVDEGYPFVFIGRRTAPEHDFDWVTSDYTPACTEATRHLLDLGHRQIAFIGQDPHTESYQDRLTGCQTALAAVPDAQLHIVPETIASQPALLDKTLRECRATAILAAGWNLVQKFFEGTDRQARDALSVAVLSDVIGSPTNSLSHIQLNRQRVGEEAVRVLIDRLDGNSSDLQHIRVPCQFVVGASTKPVVAP